MERSKSLTELLESYGTLEISSELQATYRYTFYGIWSYYCNRLFVSYDNIVDVLTEVRKDMFDMVNRIKNETI